MGSVRFSSHDSYPISPDRSKSPSSSPSHRFPDVSSHDPSRPPAAADSDTQQARDLLLRYAQAGNAQGIDAVLKRLDANTTSTIINSADLESGELLFHAAARAGSHQALRLLRPSNLDVKSGRGGRNAGMTALHIAARYGHTDAVKWLVGGNSADSNQSAADSQQNGADSNQNGADSQENGADVDVVDNSGNTPLHHAITLGHRDVAIALVEAGGCLHALNNHKLMPISFCKSSAMFDALLSSLTACPDRGRGISTYSPAVAVGDQGRVSVCSHRDAKGCSILNYAARFSRNAQVIANLIVRAGEECGSDNVEEWVGFLVTAAEFGNIEVLRALQHYVGHLMKVSLSKRGQEAAHHALVENQRAFLDELLVMAAQIRVPISITFDSIVALIPPEIKNELCMEMDGESVLQQFPMYVLLYARLFHALEFILNCAAAAEDPAEWNLTVNQWDDVHKRTCLHWAALHQRADIIEVLLHRGHSRRRRRPKHIAGEEGEADEEEEDEEVYEWKRRREPSPTIEDGEGKTAMQIAFETRNQDVLEAMRRKESFKQHEERLYKDRQLYVEGLHSILVGAVLVMGITFAGWLQLPSELLEEVAMKIYWASNAQAFFTAAASMCISIRELVPTPNMYIGEIVEEVRGAIVVDAGVFVVSLASSVVAFTAAGLAAMHRTTSGENSTTETYARLMWGSASLGFVLFATTLFVFLVQFYRYLPPASFHVVRRHFCWCWCRGLSAELRGGPSRAFYPHAHMADVRGRNLIAARRSNSRINTALQHSFLSGPWTLAIIRAPNDEYLSSYENSSFSFAFETTTHSRSSYENGSFSFPLETTTHPFGSRTHTKATCYHSEPVSPKPVSPKSIVNTTRLSVGW